MDPSTVRGIVVVGGLSDVAVVSGQAAGKGRLRYLVGGAGGGAGWDRVGQEWELASQEEPRDTIAICDLLA